MNRVARVARVARVEFADVALTVAHGTARVARAVATGVDAAPAFDRASFAQLQVNGVDFVLPLGGTAGIATRPIARGAWRVEPAAGMDGRIHAYVKDAAWVVDADVTLPIVEGRIDFARATVAHVGPDSALRLGRGELYVDAPNGRRALVRFPGHVPPGAHFESRGPLTAADAPRRGAIDLQPFVEALLSGRVHAVPAAGASAMVERVRLAGELQLGDGVVGDARSSLTLTGRAQGRNRVELSSPADRRGFGVRIAQLSAVDLMLHAADRALTAARLVASVELRLRVGAAPVIEGRIVEATLDDVTIGPAPANPDNRGKTGDVGGTTAPPAPPAPPASPTAR